MTKFKALANKIELNAQNKKIDVYIDNGIAIIAYCEFLMLFDYDKLIRVIYNHPNVHQLVVVFPQIDEIYFPYNITFEGSNSATIFRFAENDRAFNTLMKYATDISPVDHISSNSSDPISTIFEFNIFKDTIQKEVARQIYKVVKAYNKAYKGIDIEIDEEDFL